VLAELKTEGYNVAHYDMVYLKPIDDELLKEVGEKFSHVITVEDGTVKGGLGTVVNDWFNANGYSIPVKMMGLPDEFVTQGTVAQLYKCCGIDKESLKGVIKEIASKIKK
jgi:1-deoxy-D-xylulose-5-phosphate synthase